ncbi:MAG: hypothetical protein ACRBBV_15150 [Paracoccaceae bacterium]
MIVTMNERNYIMTRFITALALTAAVATPAFAAQENTSTVFTQKEQATQSTSMLSEGSSQIENRDAFLTAKEEARGVEADGVFEVYSEGPGSEWTPFLPNTYQR